MVRMAINLIRMGIKRRGTLADQLTGFGQWGIRVSANRPEDGDSSGSRKAGRVSVLLVWHLPIWSVDYGLVTWRVIRPLVHG